MVGPPPRSVWSTPASSRADLTAVQKGVSPAPAGEAPFSHPLINIARRSFRHDQDKTPIPYATARVPQYQRDVRGAPGRSATAGLSGGSSNPTPAVPRQPWPETQTASAARPTSPDGPSRWAAMARCEGWPGRVRTQGPTSLKLGSRTPRTCRRAAWPPRPVVGEPRRPHPTRPPATPRHRSPSDHPPSRAGHTQPDHPQPRAIATTATRHQAHSPHPARPPRDTGPWPPNATTHPARRAPSTRPQ
jgi:hypothetical protein